MNGIMTQWTREFEQILNEGQGAGNASLWGHKELDRTGELENSHSEKGSHLQKKTNSTAGPEGGGQVLL